jgi:hypothetical protein
MRWRSSIASGDRITRIPAGEARFRFPRTAASAARLHTARCARHRGMPNRPQRLGGVPRRRGPRVPGGGRDVPSVARCDRTRPVARGMRTSPIAGNATLAIVGEDKPRLLSADLTHTVRPRAYSATMLSSKAVKRRACFGTSSGSKLPSRSRGVSISTLPSPVSTVRP